MQVVHLQRPLFKGSLVIRTQPLGIRIFLVGSAAHICLDEFCGRKVQVRETFFAISAIGAGYDDHRNLIEIMLGEFEYFLLSANITGWRCSRGALYTTLDRRDMIEPVGGQRWRGTAALFLGAMLIGSGQSALQDYPQWRGQNRDGSASAFSEPKVWPEKLTLRWKVEVGEGYATPLVVGGTVYSFTRRDGKEIMTALSADTGQIVWQTKYPAPYKMAGPTKAHGQGPKSTPLFHRGNLYTLGISGIVSAFDAASGKLLWQKPAAAEQPFFGTASSPIADKNLVIFHPGNYGPLTAFDANTGDVKWIAKGDGMYASPTIVELGGIRQVVTMGQENIMGVALADGALLWQYPWGSEGGGMQSITPILYDGTIIVSSYHMGAKALRPILRDGKWRVDVVWDTRDVSLFLSNPVLVGDTLFGLSEKASGQFFALGVKSGKVLWLGKPRQATNTAVVKADGLLFLLDDDGELIVARSNRTAFEPLKTYTVAESATWAQPVISGNRLFVKDVSSLTLWTLSPPTSP